MGLERVERVLERLAPRRPETVLHVGGTNGKGSCVALLESLLAASGRRVGSYTSPHVLRYNERIRIGGREAPDQAIIAAFERVEAVRGDVPLTYFEYGTLAALVVFAEAGVDAAVLEVGMGGRLDAVNAVEPDAGLITNVSLDHCAWLGNDVEAIAFEKAGIMRAGKPTVFGSAQMPKAVADHAATIGARLHVAGRDFGWQPVGSGWSFESRGRRLDGLNPPAAPGRHQIDNAAAVLALLEAAGIDAAPDAEAVNRSLATAQVVGRMQSVDAGRHWLLDVAHNPAAAEALADTLRDRPVAGETVALVGMLDDKDVAGVITPLVGLVSEWIAATAESSRAIPASELGRQVANLSGRACLVAGSPAEAAARAAAVTGPDDRILVTGSFYLVGPVLAGLYSRPPGT
jgi:dihydrofolate synthase/folylpolyglutamate synthase